MELNHLLFLLFQTGVTINHFNRNIEKQAGLSLVQWCLLNTLIDLPAVSAYSLAKAVGVHPSTLTQTLKRLHRKKLIFIIADPKDIRKKNITLTRTGRDLLKITTEKIKILSKGLENLDKELNALHNHLKLKAREPKSTSPSLNY